MLEKREGWRSFVSRADLILALLCHEKSPYPALTFSSELGCCCWLSNVSRRAVAKVRADTAVKRRAKVHSAGCTCGSPDAFVWLQCALICWRQRRALSPSPSAESAAPIMRCLRRGTLSQSAREMVHVNFSNT